MTVIKWLDEHLEEFVIVLCLIVLTSLTTLNVILRYVFNSSIIWSEEVCKLSLIFSGFFSIGYCIKHGIMIKVDAFLQIIPAPAVKVLNGLTNLLLFTFFSLAFYASIHVIQGAYASGQLSAALRIPVYKLYLVPSIGLALGIIRILQRIVKYLLLLRNAANPPTSGHEVQ